MKRSFIQTPNITVKRENLAVETFDSEGRPHAGLKLDTVSYLMTDDPELLDALAVTAAEAAAQLRAAIAAARAAKGGGEGK